MTSQKQVWCEQGSLTVDLLVVDIFKLKILLNLYYKARYLKDEVSYTELSPQLVFPGVSLLQRIASNFYQTVLPFKSRTETIHI